MRKEHEKAVKQVESLEQDLSNLTVDKINEAPDSEPEPQPIDYKKMAKEQGCRYIEPKRRLSAPMGKLPDKLKEEHKRAWEYVKCIYENNIVNGEPIKFSLCLYPGDADYEWEVPANTPVMLPRMVAKHLETIPKYHTFDFIQKPESNWQKDDFTHNFAATGTIYRHKCRPLGAFS